MVQEGSELSIQVEFIRVISAIGRNGTLCHACHPIFPIASILIEAMPMDRQSNIHIIQDGDFQAIAFICLDEWSRNLAIDGQDGPEEAIQSGGRLGDVESVSAGRGLVGNLEARAQDVFLGVGCEGGRLVVVRMRMAMEW